PGRLGGGERKAPNHDDPLGAEPWRTLVGAYVWTAEIGEVFAASTPARRLETALVSGERVHPGYRDECSDGLSVAWSEIPFNRGAWVEWTRDGRQQAYALLLEPDGP